MNSFSLHHPLEGEIPVTLLFSLEGRVKAESQSPGCAGQEFVFDCLLGAPLSHPVLVGAWPAPVSDKEEAFHPGCG